jgi:hypothetical protein
MRKPNLGLVVQSRPLTDGEKRLCHSIFSTQIDFSLPQICASYWILKHYAMSPNGNVYFHPEDYLLDYSQASLGKQAWFIHEMTHVWQVQQGINVFWRALFNRRYRYELQPDKHFLSYGVEQQAQMVQDYFIQRETGQDCQVLGACLPFGA